MAEALPVFLITYLADRDTQRATAVQEFLAKLTPRERGILHDAAVMGYVQGLMRDREAGVPKDSKTMALVIDACFAFPDLYPTVNGIAGTSGLEPTWQVHTRRRGGWTHWSPKLDDPVEAREEYDRCVAANGHRWAFRLVRADTTGTIEAQHTPPESDGE